MLIELMILKKNMRPGNKIYTITFFFFISFNSFSFAEQKITTTPLINLEKIKPSFEESNEENENYTSKQNLKEKKNSKNKF